MGQGEVPGRKRIWCHFVRLWCCKDCLGIEPGPPQWKAGNQLAEPCFPLHWFFSY